MLLLVFTVLLSIVIGVIAPRFLRIDNIAVILRQASSGALPALGQMLVLITGAVDLSVGRIGGFVSVCTALLMRDMAIHPYLAMLIGVLMGAAIGYINGLLVTRLRLNSFVATLSMSFVLSGAMMVITKGYGIPYWPEMIQWIGKGSVGPVPAPSLIALLVAAGLAFLLNRTYIGRHILAVGGNEEAASLVGIRVARTKTLVYTLSGSLAAAAGVMTLARLGTGLPTVGQFWLLPSFAAPILGGTAMSGGVGSTLGTLVGALIMAVIQNAIVMTGMSVYWEDVVVGTVLVLAIFLDSLRARVRSR